MLRFRKKNPGILTVHNGPISLNTCFFPVRVYICINRNRGRKRGRERVKGEGERVGEIGKKGQRKDDIDRKRGENQGV